MIDKEYIKDVISRITDVKTEKNVVPTTASMQEIMAAIREDAMECMRAMCNDRGKYVQTSFHDIDIIRRAHTRFFRWIRKGKSL